MTLDPPVSRYLIVVLRLKKGDRFIAFDPALRLQADGVILETSGRRVSCQFSELIPAECVSPLRVTIIQALVKGVKLDRIVCDITALGASGVVLARCARSIPSLSHGPDRKRRLEKIALEAARQCGRGDAPHIMGPLPLAETLVSMSNVSLRKLYLDPESAVPLSTALADWQPKQDIGLLVGPEGGLTEEETRRVHAGGFLSCTLGPFVLRTELAAATALGVMLSLAQSKTTNSGSCS
ncbi:MAG TPA: RsmE family RNA methyltransferase [Polyangiaceae bacterium]